jgi:uncharacterized lipoprotein YddW (UPF0748 family)
MEKIIRFLAAAFFFLFHLKGVCQLAAIEGTWVTNVASSALSSPAAIQKTVAHCKRNGLTDVFVVVWNRGVTMYPSQVVKKYIGIEQDTAYRGFDPLRLFIENGHRAGLRVHAWFEFGFSYAYQDSSHAHWLKKYPSWAGRNNQGQLLKKNDFFWWNGLHPEVQTFMQELVLEVVKNYDVDGIQGDDRLPAMPAEGGYDEYTLRLYATENNGKSPPADPKEPSWLQWKADRLSAFGKKIYQSVKSIKPKCLVSWAPSIYPWSKEQYLQDWPQWLKEGYADLIIPQVYRYKLDAYEQTLKAIESQVPASMKYKVIPGILTSLGNGYRAEDSTLRSMIRLNRKHGFAGEVLFYYETIRESKNPIFEPSHRKK